MTNTLASATNPQEINSMNTKVVFITLLFLFVPLFLWADCSSFENIDRDDYNDYFLQIYKGNMKDSEDILACYESLISLEITAADSEFMPGYLLALATVINRMVEIDHSFMDRRIDEKYLGLLVDYDNHDRIYDSISRSGYKSNLLAKSLVEKKPNGFSLFYFESIFSLCESDFCSVIFKGIIETIPYEDRLLIYIEFNEFLELDLYSIEIILRDILRSDYKNFKFLENVDYFKHLDSLDFNPSEKMRLLFIFSWNSLPSPQWLEYADGMALEGFSSKSMLKDYLGLISRYQDRYAYHDFVLSLLCEENKDVHPDIFTLLSGFEVFSTDLISAIQENIININDEKTAGHLIPLLARLKKCSDEFSDFYQYLDPDLHNDENLGDIIAVFSRDDLNSFKCMTMPGSGFASEYEQKNIQYGKSCNK